MNTLSLFGFFIAHFFSIIVLEIVLCVNLTLVLITNDDMSANSILQYPHIGSSLLTFDQEMTNYIFILNQIQVGH